MSLGIRIALLIGAVCLFVYILYSVRKAKMRIEDTLFWAFLSFLILLMSIFPTIAIEPSRWLGFQAPVNFVFLFFIAVLVLKCFLNSRQISRLETKVNELTQHLAIDRLDGVHSGKYADAHLEQSAKPGAEEPLPPLQR